MWLLQAPYMSCSCQIEPSFEVKKELLANILCELLEQRILNDIVSFNLINGCSPAKYLIFSLEGTLCNRCHADNRVTKLFLYFVYQN